MPHNSRKSAVSGKVLILGAKTEKARFISEPGLCFNAATTYSPTHFRAQYNRPCGA